MIVLAHADGALPNLALMRLGTWLRDVAGEEVRLVRRPEDIALRDRGRVDLVLGSSIFRFSDAKRARFDEQLGSVIWGGTGVDIASSLDSLGYEVDWDQVRPDYSLYSDFEPSLGFLSRGCRLKCGFCVVPAKEGKPHAVASVHDIWRGEGHPRHLHLLDNDAFAPQLADHWREAVREIREGGFRVCFSQGLNLRLIDEESARALSTLRSTGHDFEKRRLFTAWDSIGDETVFQRGVATLRHAGIPGHHLTVYMLTGYDPKETWEAIFYRFRALVALRADPYPMVFDRAARPDLCAFQRWALRHLYRHLPFPAYAGSGDGGRQYDTRLTPEAREAARIGWDAVYSGGWRPRARGLALAPPDAAG